MDLSTLPTAGGTLVIQTPAEIYSRPDLGVFITTADQLMAWHVAMLAKYHKPTAWHNLAPVVAFIAAGAWRFTCPSCNSPVSCAPSWSIGCCFECGSISDSITFPDAAADIEAVLLARPGLFTRNALIGETVEMLEAENLAHGLPARVG